MKREAKRTILSMIVGIVKSGLVSFAIYLCTVVFIHSAIYADVPDSERNYIPVYLLMTAFYGGANYLTYIRWQSERATLQANADFFSVKGSLLAYLQTDGKYLLLIYGILAVVYEISSMVELKPIRAILLFLFPIAAIFDKIPIFRTAIGYAVTVLMILSLTLFKQYRIHRYWNKSKHNK